MFFYKWEAQKSKMSDYSSDFWEDFFIVANSMAHNVCGSFKNYENTTAYARTAQR